MEYSYRHGFTRIGGGIAEVAIVTYNVIMAHKALSALVVSVMLNIGLMLAYANKCDVLLKSDADCVRISMQNDSLRQANVRYFRLSGSDITNLDSLRNKKI